MFIHQRNIVYKYKLQKKPIIKLIHHEQFHDGTIMRTYYMFVLQFHGFMNIFLKVIKQAFRRNVNLDYVRIFSFSQSRLETRLFIYLSSVVRFFEITLSGCAL